MIASITTLKIMTPHRIEFETVQDLVRHLVTIGYLHDGSARPYAALDVAMTVLEPEHDGVAYIISQATRSGQRAHRIDFPTVAGSITFEHELNAAGVRRV